MTDGMDFSAIMAQAQEMQSKMMEAQASQAQTTLEGSAGGGKVKVAVNGNGEFGAVSIAPEALTEDASMLEDLVLAAIKDAAKQVSELQMESLGDIGLPGQIEGE